MMDRLAAIEIFIRVVDTGSFSAAARHYDVGQPAVSKAIAQLEEWLGVKLLLRTTRALTPTEAGTSFYQRARRAVEETDEAVLAARGTASGLAGKLRVSAAVCFARLHIVPRLPEFLAQHPNLELELVLDDRNITPAHRFKDGHNYVPSPKWVVFGHHFAAIAGAGPLVGPTLAAQFGYAPGLIWLVAGAVLAGAVQDLTVLIGSLRHNGKSLPYIVQREVGPLTGLLAM
ncbi:MAG: carbon starvation CstA family protein, partial [Paraburkholderia sp.]